MKKNNLSTHAVTTIASLRGSLDQAGQKTKRLLIVGDGSFCNRTIFRPALDRTEIIARARRDLKLCRKASAGQRRFYDPAKFTPEQIRDIESIQGDLLQATGYALATPPEKLHSLLAVRLMSFLYPLYFEFKLWLKSKTPLARMATTGRMGVNQRDISKTEDAPS